MRCPEIPRVFDSILKKKNRLKNLGKIYSIAMTERVFLDEFKRRIAKVHAKISHEIAKTHANELTILKCGIALP